MAKIIFVDDEGKQKVLREGKFNEYDVILQSDYIATHLWTKEDVANVLRDNDLPNTAKNVQAVVDTGLLKYLEECTEDEWEVIRNAVMASKEDKLLDEVPMKPADLAEVYEHVRQYWIAEDPYRLYSFIMEGEDPSDDNYKDIAAAIENTLHRMLDAGADDELIRSEMGLLNESNNDEDMDEYPDSISVDLGYYLPGNIILVDAADAA